MSQSKIYVGNLSYNTTEDELRDHFSQYGSIDEVKLIIDFSTGRSKGFAFISYSSDQDCENAVEKANGFELDGRSLKVNIARDDNRRPAGSGGARRPSNNSRPSYRDDRN
ncbi:MAG: RNA-binding protein [Gammaproteobacteria bacterium]|nr:RNA-binding protein [Gammaproteobacteria bacterium]